jgi:myo-inositol-1(or 4)-monophosphatase
VTVDRRRDLELAIGAARAAGASIMRYFGSELAVRHKGPDQPVTDADLEADALLARHLLAAGAERGWLSEETVDRPARLERDSVWIVDPLDGTRSFVEGYPEFAVSVALAEAGAVVLGVVYNPAANDLFWAVRGGGAHRDRDGAGGERLHLPAPPSGVARSFLASRSEIRRGEFDPFAAREVRPLGSTAYKLVAVAAGMGDAFVSRGPKSEWDVAAGALILEEAGGTVTDTRGRRLRFNRPDPYVHGVVATHAALHDDLLELVTSLPAPRLRR